MNRFQRGIISGQLMFLVFLVYDKHIFDAVLYGTLSLLLILVDIYQN